MNKKTITISVLVLLILGLTSAVVTSSKQKKSEQVIGLSSPNTTIDVDILYWGTTCPYCHDVIDWIKENDTDKKLNLIQKEV